MLGNRYADWGSKTLTHSSLPPTPRRPPFLEFLLHLSSRRAASRQTPFPRSGLCGFKTSLFSFLGRSWLRAGVRQSSHFNAASCQWPGKGFPGHRPGPSLCHRAEPRSLGGGQRPPSVPAPHKHRHTHTKGRRRGDVTRRPSGARPEGGRIPRRQAFLGCQAAQPPLPPAPPAQPRGAPPPHVGTPRRTGRGREGGGQHGAPGKEGGELLTGWLARLRSEHDRPARASRQPRRAPAAALK